MKKERTFLISLFFLAIAITSVYAQDENETNVDITLFPQQLSERWNISVLAGGVFLSVATLFAFLLPMQLLRLRGIAYIIIGFGILGFCCAIGWLHYWVLLLITLIIAVLYAGKVKRSL